MYWGFFSYLFFSFYFRYIFFVLSVLWPLSDSKPCIYLIYIFDEVVITFSPISQCIVSFLSLCTFFLFLVCNLLFLFCLKCFRNIGCQSLSCHELSSCKAFQEFVLGLDFIVFNKWIRVEWFMTSLVFYLFVVVLSRIAKEGDC